MSIPVNGNIWLPIDSSLQLPRTLMLCQQPKGWMNTTKNHKTNLESHLTIRKACLLSAAVNLVPIVAVEDSEGEQGDL